MLVINYNGNKPFTDYYKFSVQGNNKADVIRFLVQLNQGGLSFDENYHFYAKVQCVDDDFYDKVELDDFEFSDSENLLKANFKLESKHTSHKQIEVSLSCEDLRTSKKIVWQTQIVKVAISNGVNADEEIANLYPTILEQLQKQIDELKEGGGGGNGGSNEVIIDKIWLSYEDKNKQITHDKLTIYDGTTDKIYVNCASLCYIHIKSKPIGQKTLDEIDNGRLVLRFNYPVKYNRRGFSHYVKERELNAIIFINENDVFENDYGEKYIHIKETAFDFFSRFYKLTDENAILSPIENNDHYSQLIASLSNLEEDIGWRFSGIPYKSENYNYDNVGHSRTRLKLYVGGNTPVGVGASFNLRQSFKLTEYNFYAPLFSEDYWNAVAPRDYGFDCHFWRNNQQGSFGLQVINTHTTDDFGRTISSVKLIRKLNLQLLPVEIHRFERRKLNACNLRPSFAVINKDYAEMSDSENCWLKTYPQSEQSINIPAPICSKIDDDDYENLLAIMRIRISPKI